MAVGLTGIGGGSFTVPALVLIAGLPASEAVGTAFVFAGAIRLVAAPFYMLRKHVHAQYLWLLLKGAVPGLLVGTFALRLLSKDAGSPGVIILLGMLLAASSAVTFAPRIQNPGFAKKNSRWLPWLAMPIGVESGFSSAGAGALGAVLLLNFSEITSAQVVGTDLIFGIVLAAIGSAFHLQFGSVSGSLLLELIIGGIPGVLVGCALARRVPAQRLKAAVAVFDHFLDALKLRVFPSLKNHNLKQLLDRGLLVTVNSDDPAYFGGYVADNFRDSAAALGLNRDYLLKLARNSFVASFLSAEQHRAYLGDVDRFAAQPSLKTIS